MAKRFTDTEKWKDDWYLELNNDYRIIWQWLIDNCNHAGVCKRNIALVNIFCKTNVTEQEMIGVMDGRIIQVKNDWFIPKFLKFQYSDLQTNRPVIVSVRKELIKTGYYKLIPIEFSNDYRIIPELLTNDYLIIKDKDKDKDKDSFGKSENLLDKNKKSNGKFSGNFNAQGEELYAAKS